MNAPPFAVASLLLGLALPAQVPTPLPPQPGDLAALQAPAPAEEVREPTQQERVEQLEAQRQKLEKELEQIRSVEGAGGLAPRVKAFLKERVIMAKTVMDQTAKTPSEPAPAPAPEGGDPVTVQEIFHDAAGPHGARLLGDAEKAALAADVVFTVDGVAVTQAEFDTAYDYLKSYPQQLADDDLKKQAVLELVRLKAAQAAFRDGAREARAKILGIERRLKEEAGADFAKIAEETSDCPSKHQGGDLNFFGRAGMDFTFTQAAFGAKVGETTGAVPSMFGWHLIKVTARENGADAGGDRVRASHILALYTQDQMARAKVMQRVQGGQVDLAFASDEFRKYTPNELAR